MELRASTPLQGGASDDEPTAESERASSVEWMRAVAQARGFCEDHSLTQLEGVSREGLCRTNAASSREMFRARIGAPTPQRISSIELVTTENLSSLYASVTTRTFDHPPGPSIPSWRKALSKLETTKRVSC